VASSGAESLIAFDNLGDVSTMIVHDDEDGLTLDAETPLFRWFSNLWSDVAWDGAAYTIGWRYAAGVASWLGAAHVTRSGLPFDYRFVATGILPTRGWGQPSIAANDAGVVAFAVSEGTGTGAFSIDRARLYLDSELAPMPAPPPPPTDVISYFGGNTARIDWQSDGAAAGFVIEAWSPYYQSWASYPTVIPGDARSTTVYAPVGTLLRVRALGPGGLSEGTIATIGSTQRRRAVRR
jgi:hypothetical protein